MKELIDFEYYSIDSVVEKYCFNSLNAKVAII